MIRDGRVLRAGFVPSEIEHRDAEIGHLSSVLSPLAEEETAETAVVTGPSGVGKTCATRFVTERLHEQAPSVGATYVNCWRNHTRFRALYEILDDVGRTADIHRRSTPHDELIDRLQRYDGPRTVVVLDEADQLDDPGIVYDLNGLPRFALVCIANAEEELFRRVDDRLVSRLRSSEHVRMEPYRQDELRDILAARARRGLEPESVTDDQLLQVADAAAGDARLGIGILRSAANAAERRDRERISDDLLEDAVDAARAEIRRRNLDVLSPHQRAVYDVVDEDGPIEPAAIYDRYAERVDDSRTRRTVRSYLSKLERYGLFTSSGATRTRTYDTAADSGNRCGNG